MHRLLARQLRRHYGGPESVPAELGPLLDAISAAYEAADTDRRMLEHSMDVTSEELLESNRALRDELGQRERAEQRYRTLVEATSQMVWGASADGRWGDERAWGAFTGQAPEAGAVAHPHQQPPGPGQRHREAPGIGHDVLDVRQNDRIVCRLRISVDQHTIRIRNLI